MTYMSIAFYIFVLAALLLYYVLPLKYRWLVLLGGSIFFYWKALDTGTGMPMILVTIALAYGTGLLLQKRKNRIILAAAVVLMILPWFCVKNGNYVLEVLLHKDAVSWIVPLGISFYTLQIISYLADIYMGRIEAQTNPAKFALYVLFFRRLCRAPSPVMTDSPDSCTPDMRSVKKQLCGDSTGFYGVFS